MDLAKLAGLGLLAVGIGLILFTFSCAYGEFRRVGPLLFSGSIPEVLTQALGPLIEACIKAMFLGIMGWAGVVLTSRGVQLLRAPPAEEETRPPPPYPAGTGYE